MSMTHAMKRLSSGNDTECRIFLQYRPVKESRAKKVVQVPCRMARSRLKAMISPSTVRDENSMTVEKGAVHVSGWRSVGNERRMGGDAGGGRE